MNNKCPKCGSKSYTIKSHTRYGHGDCTHECHVVCNSCGNKGPVSADWGRPTRKSFEKALQLFQEKKL
jgi:hypothetical protein